MRTTPLPPQRLLSFLLAALAAGLYVPVARADFIYTDFSSVAGLQINGHAEQVGPVLRLTPATTSRAGSAFTTTTVDLGSSNSFSTYFQFRITDSGGSSDLDGPGADGIVFVVQTVSNNVGAVGGQIGYGGIAPSLGVEFDTWPNSEYSDPNGNHVGINLNGNVVSVETQTEPVRFNNGGIWHVWIDFDGAAQRLEVRWSMSAARPVAAQLVRSGLDLVAVLGQSTAFVGFTSGTGAAFGAHDILQWEYRGAFAPVGTYQVSGQVRDLNDSPVPNVPVIITGGATGTQVTDSDGRYLFTGLTPGGTYTVAPERPLFTFDPVSQTFPNLSNDEVAAFFVVTSGVFTRYFAEGATGSLFTTEIALLNATGIPTDAIVTFQTPDGTTVPVPLSLNALDRRTVNPGTIPGLEDTALSTVIESTQPIIADRTMRWDGRGYGSHTETSVASPLTQWYLAEGATINGFQLFYLIQNPGAEAASVEVTYLRPAPDPPLVKTYPVVGSSRFTIWVNTEEFDTPGGPQTLLASAEFAAAISSDRPVIVERAMYLTRSGRLFEAGHESAASPELSTSWFLAEGATGAYFDLFALIVNPNPTPADVEVTYLLPDSSFVKTYQVPGQSRFTIWVDTDDPRLADTAVSMALRSTNAVPILVERAMWWPGGFGTWFEGHNSRGAVETGEKWGLADGAVGGPLGLETYVLVANTSSFQASVQVTLVFEDGTSAEQTYAVPASSRFNVPVGVFFPETAGTRFGIVVESLSTAHGTAQIVVERASYNDAMLDGQTVQWAAGANAFGTKLR
jgi:hypothetical protein